MTLTFRSVAIAAALSASTLSAYAGLTLPFQGTQSNSVQAFSDKSVKSFKAIDAEVLAKGNTTALDAEGKAFSFPITKIVIDGLSIGSGSAVGSALYIERYDYVAETDTEEMRGVTLANFTINYKTKQVLADTTPKGGQTIAQMPLYNFTVDQKLALKLKFPLTITGHELLNNLLLTPEAKAAMISSLNLPAFAVPLLDQDFGTLTQDVSTVARKPAAPTKPYAPQ
jgi:hypothetical protein